MSLVCHIVIRKDHRPGERRSQTHKREVIYRFNFVGVGAGHKVITFGLVYVRAYAREREIEKEKIPSPNGVDNDCGWANCEKGISRPDKSITHGFSLPALLLVERPSTEHI